MTDPAIWILSHRLEAELVAFALLYGSGFWLGWLLKPTPQILGRKLSRRERRLLYAEAELAAKARRTHYFDRPRPDLPTGARELDLPQSFQGSRL